MGRNRIGELRMQFDSYRNGVYYYRLHITVGSESRTILMPRYHAYLGWIEVFGLPPQFEWVALNDIDDFTSMGELRIDDMLVSEQVQYVHDVEEKEHHLMVTRDESHNHEEISFVECYKEAPTKIDTQVDFVHTHGSYTCSTQKYLVGTGNLSDREEQFVTDTEDTHGSASQVWSKTFTAKGSLPPLYYKFFPLVPGVDLTFAKGSVLEVGYMDEGEGVDAVHGEWFKRFEVNGAVFYIHEHGYSSTEIETDKGTERIKDTYIKELFV